MVTMGFVFGVLYAVVALLILGYDVQRKGFDWPQNIIGLVLWLLFWIPILLVRGVKIALTGKKEEEA